MTTTILTLLILIIFSTVAQATEPQDSTGNCGATNELETDSVKTNLLNEIVVRGESVRFEDGKIIFTPSKQSKNLAKDIPGLIGLMNTGVLHVVNGQITTRGGQKVTVYINGEIADRSENATFWANNVLSVEY